MENKLSFTTDEEAWRGCHEEDKWVFNKLEVARRFGMTCGLREEPIPENINKVVVRPIYNLSGMGLGAAIKDRWEGEATEEQCPLGFFWAEYLDGDIYSVDYMDSTEDYRYHIAVIGERDGLLFKSWRTCFIHFDTASNAIDLRERYKTVNVEYINGLPIEIHLRPNPDLKHFRNKGGKKLIPVFAPEGEFISDPAPTSNGQRLGFIIEK